MTADESKGVEEGQTLGGPNPGIEKGSTAALLKDRTTAELLGGHGKISFTPSLEDRTPWLSKISFSFLNPLVSLAHEKMLWHHDLGQLGTEDHCNKIMERFDQCWEVERKKVVETLEKEGDAKGFSALLWSFYHMNSGQFLLSAALEVLTRGALFVTPFLLDFIIRFLEGKDEQGVWYGVILALLMGVCIAVSGVAENRMQAILSRISFNMQASIMGKIYTKYFQLSPDSMAKTGTGNVLNMIGEDTQRIFQLMPIVNFLWSAPLQMVAVLVLLLVLVGWAPALGAFGVLVVVLIVMRWSNDKMQVLENERAKLMDARVKLLTELIAGMKAVKLYAWEQPMKKAIEKERRKELTKILHIYLLRAMNVALFNMAPVLMSVAIFFIFVAQGNDLDPAVVFGTVALVNLIRAPLIILPILQTAYNSSTVSFTRIHDFLTLDERSVDPSSSTNAMTNDFSVILKGTFSWPYNAAKGEKKMDESNRLSSDNTEAEGAKELKMKKLEPTNSKKQGDGEKKGGFSVCVDISVKPKGLLQIVGPVGCGKSSILCALLGNMNEVIVADMKEQKEMTKGSAIRALHGTVAYVPQQPWVMNKTLRDNITFGNHFDQEWYDKVVWLCALGQDLKQLPQGDQTMIGEQGINLSGGQKQRVALARAIYANADVYLLDDPLSAVDQHVAAHIFFTTIQHHLKEKTVVLATHQVQFLRYASEVAVMTAGSVVATGPYEELKEKHLSEYSQVDQKDWLASGHTVDYNVAKEQEKKKNKQEENKEKDKGSTTPAAAAAAAVDSGDSAIEVKEEEGSKKGKGGEQEEGKEKMDEKPKYTPQGGLPLSLHLTYFRAAAPLWVMAVLLVIFIVTQLAILASDYWLAAWTGDFFDQGRTFYMVGYAVLAIIGAIIAFSRIALYAYAARNASKNIHDDSVDTMMDATMRFFDNTPMGNVTALFSRDQSMIDTFLPELYNVNLTLILMLVVSLLVVAVIVPWFFLVFIPLMALAWKIQKRSLPAVGNITLLNLMSLGPVFSYFQESMHGASVIRASKRVKQCVDEAESKIDTLNNAYYHSQLMIKWVDVRMDIFSALMVALCSLIVVLTKGRIGVELAALVLTFALSVGSILGFIVQIRAYMEMMLTAVLRCDMFKKNTPRERFTGNVSVDAHWPEKPSLDFEDVCFRYGDATDSKGPLVLQNLSLSVPAGKKTAIIGRTGAGKSSLANAILRVNELASGRIKIGGDPVHDIPLRALRERVSVIPQDPVLFTGTIRFNLDPFGTASEEHIWKTLRRVQLDKVVKEQPGGLSLESPVRENGSNFSIGQRQLFCVARALLTESKLLIMDEATASVDYATDARIQEVLRSEFKECTVLTIAHRIQTILDYDVIMALEKGRLAEFGNPKDLLKNPKSYFSELLTEEQKEERKQSDEKEAALEEEEKKKNIAIQHGGDLDVQSV